MAFNLRSTSNLNGGLLAHTLQILCLTVNAEVTIVYTTNIINFSGLFRLGGEKDKSLSRIVLFFPPFSQLNTEMSKIVTKVLDSYSAKNSSTEQAWDYIQRTVSGVQRVTGES